MTLKMMQGLYSFVLVFVTAWISKYIVDLGLVPFYDLLEKPEFTPEGKYFSYAWMLIYFLQFISFYLILDTRKTIEQFDDANALFVSQLFLQIVWVFSFFYMQQLGASAIVIVLLDMVVALMLHTFIFINLWSFILLLPYLAWLMFATVLNIYIYFLN
ncbi:MAG: tryptophan-rich sensory protein [Acetobacter sp.]|nr:tryptophan-rich sensory protein [Acetobacter sp.]